MAFLIQSLTTQLLFIFSATLIFPLSSSSSVFSTAFISSSFFEISIEFDKSSYPASIISCVIMPLIY